MWGRYWTKDYKDEVQFSSMRKELLYATMWERKTEEPNIL
ncbi:rCG35792 [Rattus norvegicus]|uniref:RCG35792 n=1 Tax=Rattus norvegicus TaxID=10116 RepID=A6IJS0_RAT|nr:rCG35792 [Rattus norvegicus]